MVYNKLRKITFSIKFRFSYLFAFILNTACDWNSLISFVRQSFIYPFAMSKILESVDSATFQLQ